MKQRAISIIDEMMEEHKKVLKNEGMCDYDIDNTIRSNILNEAKSRIQALGDGWIPVTERLPEEGRKVLICSLHAHLNDPVCARYTDRLGWIDTNHKVEMFPTHWAYLPEFKL